MRQWHSLPLQRPRQCIGAPFSRPFPAVARGACVMAFVLLSTQQRLAASDQGHDRHCVTQSSKKVLTATFKSGSHGQGSDTALSVPPSRGAATDNPLATVPSSWCEASEQRRDNANRSKGGLNDCVAAFLVPTGRLAPGWAGGLGMSTTG